MATEEDEDEAEGGQEAKCSSRSQSAPSMYRDWVLSLRRPGCSRLLTGYRDAAGPEAGRGRTPRGSLTVSGMTGVRRCSGFLEEQEEDSDVEEAQLDREVVEPAGARFGNEVRPAGALGRWDRSEGLGGQIGLSLLC